MCKCVKSGPSTILCVDIYNNLKSNDFQQFAVWNGLSCRRKLPEKWKILLAFSELSFRTACVQHRQGRNEIRWRPGQEASWRPHVRTWGLSEANYCIQEILVAFLTLFSAPTVIWRPHSVSAPGELCPLASSRYAPEYRVPFLRVCLGNLNYSIYPCI